MRYWAVSARPGVDTAFNEDQMKVGRRLATKLLNVTKFVLGIARRPGRRRAGDVTDPLDVAMLARLDAAVAEATAAFEGFDYARALERTEAFFWWFCDDYVELVKGRAYGGRGDGPAASAHAALGRALEALQRLLAPMLPFATEEAWSWSHDTSVHATTWPTPAGRRSVRAVARRHQRGAGAGPAGQDRGQAEPAGHRRPARRHRAGALRPTIEAAGADLVDALTVTDLEVVEGDALDVAVELGGPTDT